MKKFQVRVNGQPVGESTTDYSQAHADLMARVAPAILKQALEGEPSPVIDIETVLDSQD